MIENEQRGETLAYLHGMDWEKFPDYQLAILKKRVRRQELILENGGRSENSRMIDRAFCLKVKEALMKVTKSRYHISVSDLLGGGREARLTQARMLFAVIYRELTGDTYAETGRILRRDHCTIMHYAKQVSGYCQYDRAFAREYKEFKDEVNKVLCGNSTSSTECLSWHSSC